VLVPEVLRMRAALLFVMALLLTACQSGGSREGSSREDDRLKLAEINTQLALAYMQDGDNELALQKLESALESNPKSVNTRNAMALLYNNLGEYKEAEENYRKALEFDARNITALNNYGRFLCQQKRFDEGQARLKQAIDNPLNPVPENAMANAGTCAMQAGDAIKAEDFFRAALQRSPRLSPALLSMAQLSLDQQNPLQARAYYQRYVEISPQSPRTLWLGMRIEHALGNQDAVASHALQLKNRFPDSPEYGQYQRGELE